MVRGILKMASNVPEEGRNQHEARSISFALGTKKQPRRASNYTFVRKRKLEEKKPLSYSLSYYTLRFNDPDTNQKYLKRQRKDV